MTIALQPLRKIRLGEIAMASGPMLQIESAIHPAYVEGEPHPLVGTYLNKDDLIIAIKTHAAEVKASGSDSILSLAAGGALEILAEMLALETV